MVRIAVSMGDPAGIGPELAVRAARDFAGHGDLAIVLYGVPEILREAARRFTPDFVPTIQAVGQMPFADLVPGHADARCGRLAYDAVVSATQDVLGDHLDALVTAPMNKYAVNLAGIPFTGHTELIAELSNTPDFAMMQSSGTLRVAFVTTHIALAEVPQAASFERIVRVGELLHDAIRAEGIRQPILAAAAINPHAGENGCMGREDELVVKPALAELKRRGIAVEGPFPPDTLFIAKTRNRFDGILSMYHDQGHIPFKMLAFDSGVNSTLGLPMIRTSPDHGTAFEIAWQGIADPGSFYAALELAAKRAQRG